MAHCWLTGNPSDTAVPPMLPSARSSAELRSSSSSLENLLCAPLCRRSRSFAFGTAPGQDQVQAVVATAAGRPLCRISSPPASPDLLSAVKTRGAASPHDAGDVFSSSSKATAAAGGTEDSVPWASWSLQREDAHPRLLTAERSRWMNWHSPVGLMETAASRVLLWQGLGFKLALSCSLELARKTLCKRLKQEKMHHRE